ncbi:MAG: acetylglutamate kinase [Flavobacteriaceae bacterium]|nr:MAG: acetylglutamate kinase [Flavobacteriaceae bacterium]
MKPTLHVFKIGGGILDDPKELDLFLKDFSNFASPKILIHGGGKGANKQLEALGIKPLMVEGRRITDKNTLEIVTQIYAGGLNKLLVAKLQSLETDALGLSGADANVILCEKRSPEPIDYGFVGDVQSINKQRIHQFLQMQLTPVFCAITHDKKGQLLNTNADTVASRIALAMADLYQVELHFCFDQNGVLLDINDPSSVVEKITPDIYQSLKESGQVFKGMIPKLDNAFEVISGGVEMVILEHSKNINSPIKTRICLK